MESVFKIKRSTLENDPRSTNCPACGTQNLECGSAAVVSPWVVALSRERKIPAPKYKICAHCKSSWFDRGYSDKILDSLYKSYRGEEYFRIRNSWEPTYTKTLNSGLNSGAEWLEGRRLQITKSLESAGVSPSNMHSVLDFGGGHGGVMPKFRNRYLLEANESVIPEPGVELVRLWEEAKKLSLDLVMCCGVLEHLNDPPALVRTILELESRVYLFEVPTGIPARRRGPSANILFLKILASNRQLWRLVQTIERRLGRAWWDFFPLRCSEHLQFFSKAGLVQLLQNCGLEVLEVRETEPNRSLINKENLGFESGLIAVCRKQIEY